MTHDLKIWPEYFIAILVGSKTFEIRNNDRNFRVRDILHLQEWDPKTEKYTGQAMKMKVTFVMNMTLFGIENLVAMSIIPYFDNTKDASTLNALVFNQI